MLEVVSHEWIFELGEWKELKNLMCLNWLKLVQVVEGASCVLIGNSDTLEEFFARVLREGMAGQELGEQTIF